jgi:hypothetical protein
MFKKGFLNTAPTKELPNEEPAQAKLSFDREKLWYYTKSYVENTVQGWYAGMWTVCNLDHSCKDDLKFKVSLYVFAEKYINDTAVHFIKRNDKYVTDRFEEFRVACGGRLSCCYLDKLAKLLTASLNFVTDKMGYIEIPKDIYCKNAQRLAESYLKGAKDYYLDEVEKEWKNCKKNLRDALVIDEKGGKPFVKLSIDVKQC